MEFIAKVIMDQHLAPMIFIFQINVEVIQIQVITLLLIVPILLKEENMLWHLILILKLLIMKYIIRIKLNYNIYNIKLFYYIKIYI